MNKEISYKFKDKKVEDRFEDVKSKELVSFIDFLTNRYQGSLVLIEEVNIIEVDNIAFGLELTLRINDKKIELSKSTISGFYNVQEVDKIMRFIGESEPVSVTYKFQNIEIIIGMNQKKMTLLVQGVKGLFDIEFICDKEYEFNDDREKIIEYFRENHFDNPRITTLLNIITKLVDVDKCDIIIKHDDDFIFYKHGALMKYKETLVEGKKTKILSMYFDNETNKYVEEKIIKTKKHTKKYNII